LASQFGVGTTAEYRPSLELRRDAVRSEGVKGKVRARRFLIQMPLRYRVNGSSWRKGTTDNISRSGVLFQAESALQPNTPLELTMALPAEVSGDGSAEVFCRGCIVRSVPSTGDGSHPRLAATISHYRVLRP
jgi:hypothetical protein